MKAYVNPYIIKLIEEAIAEEISDIILFEKLSDADAGNAELYADIAADELKHKKMLQELYADLSGKTYMQPVREKSVLQDTDSPDKEKLIRDKADNAAMYRTLYFAMPHSSHADRNILFEIMTDEMIHLSKLSSIK